MSLDIPNSIVRAACAEVDQLGTNVDHLDKRVEGGADMLLQVQPYFMGMQHSRSDCISIRFVKFMPSVFQ